MLVIAYSLVLFLCAVLLANAVRHRILINKARKEGKIGKQKPTMFDVRQLLMEGRKDLAIEIYCEIFNTSSSKAKKDVEELQRSLKV